MKRGDLYLVPHPSARDPKKARVFVVVSRQILIDSKFSTVICAPVYTAYHGITTQVPVGIEDGLKHDSSIYCDDLVSLPKSRHYPCFLRNQQSSTYVSKLVKMKIAV